MYGEWHIWDKVIQRIKVEGGEGEGKTTELAYWSCIPGHPPAWFCESPCKDKFAMRSASASISSSSFCFLYCVRSQSSSEPASSSSSNHSGLYWNWFPESVTILERFRGETHQVSSTHTTALPSRTMQILCLPQSFLLSLLLIHPCLFPNGKWFRGNRS